MRRVDVKLLAQEHISAGRFRGQIDVKPRMSHIWVVSRRRHTDAKLNKHLGFCRAGSLSCHEITTPIKDVATSLAFAVALLLSTPLPAQQPVTPQRRVTAIPS